MFIGRPLGMGRCRWGFSKAHFKGASRRSIATLQASRLWSGDSWSFITRTPPIPLSEASRKTVVGNLLMPTVGHAAQRKKILPTVAKDSKKTYRQSALLGRVHGAVWTCIIKERNTRKYEYIIQLATIEITSACIL